MVSDIAFKSFLQELLSHVKVESKNVFESLRQSV